MICLFHSFFFFLYIYSVYVCPSWMLCLFSFSLSLFLYSVHVACICLYFFLFYYLTISNNKRNYFNILDIYLLFFFFSRWDMNDMQIEYVKPTKNISVGIYGWRKRCLYCLLIILTLIVFINLCLTFWLSVSLGLHWVC